MEVRLRDLKGKLYQFKIPKGFTIISSGCVQIDDRNLCLESLGNGKIHFKRFPVSDIGRPVSDYYFVIRYIGESDGS